MEKAPLNKKLFTGDARHYALIALVSMLVMALQFLEPGYYHLFLEDALYTPRYIKQFEEAFRQGILYPRWMPECFAGYGSPVFVFYSPLFYFLSALLSLAGLGQAMAVTSLKLLGTFVGGVFVYHLIRDRHSSRAALIAALLYISLPTRVFDLYFINTPAGRFSEAWMPVALFCTGRLVEGPFRRKYFAFAALSYAALILSHITTAYLFTPFLVAYGLYGVNPGYHKRSAVRVALVIGTGICLSAVFFVPVLFERQFVQLGLLSSLNVFSDWRKPILGFIDTPVSPGTLHLWSALRNSIFIEAGVAAALLYVLRRHKVFRLDRGSKIFAWSLLACIFMMSALSAFLWKHLPGFSLVNFPSRYTVIYMLLLAALSGPAVDAFLLWKGRPKAISAAFLLILLCLAVFDAVLIKKSPRPVTEAQALADTNQNDMVEYLPKWTSLQYFFRLKKEDPIFSSKDMFSVNISNWGYIDRRFKVDAPSGVRLGVKTFFFPGWRAWVDERETSIFPDTETGEIVLNVPPGSHHVRLRFMDTPPRAWGKAISLATLAALVFPYGAVHRRRHINP